MGYRAAIMAGLISALSSHRIYSPTGISDLYGRNTENPIAELQGRYRLSVIVDEIEKATQTAQENSPDAMNGVLGVRVSDTPEKGCTGVFSGPTKYEAWLEFQIEHGHAPDGYHVEMTREYAHGRRYAFLAALAYFRREFGHTSGEG